LSQTVGGGGMSNVSILMEYFIGVGHLESLLVPHTSADEEYKKAIAILKARKPTFSKAWGDLNDNIEFLTYSQKWLSLLVALAYKQKLLTSSSGSWDENESEVVETDGDEGDTPSGDKKP